MSLTCPHCAKAVSIEIVTAPVPAIATPAPARPTFQFLAGDVVTEEITFKYLYRNGLCAPFDSVRNIEHISFSSSPKTERERTLDRPEIDAHVRSLGFEPVWPAEVIDPTKVIEWQDGDWWAEFNTWLWLRRGDECRLISSDRIGSWVKAADEGNTRLSDTDGDARAHKLGYTIHHKAPSSVKPDSGPIADASILVTLTKRVQTLEAELDRQQGRLHKLEMKGV